MRCGGVLCATHVSLACQNYIRVLLGRAAYELPSGSINERHLATAITALRNFDWVIPLHSKSRTFVIKNGLGWSSPEPNVQRDERQRNIAPFSLEEQEHLRQLNSFDYALIREGDRLHTLDVDSLMQMQHRAPGVRTFGACCGLPCHHKQSNSTRTERGHHKTFVRNVGPTTDGPH